MDGSRVSSPVPAEQQVSLAFPRYFVPLEYHPHVVGNLQPLPLECHPDVGGSIQPLPLEYHSHMVGSIQPLATRVVEPAKRKRKSKLSVEENGRSKNRWRAHKKDTCQCAVCKQVRGELSSTWFNHDRSNCKCSVCRQSRGEKRSLREIVSGEPKAKPSLISNRVRRLMGRVEVPASRSSLVLPEQNTLLLSDSSSANGSKNLPSGASSMEASKALLATPTSQSCLDGAKVNGVFLPSTLGSDLGLLQNMTEIVDSHPRNNTADLRHLLDAGHLKSHEFSGKFPNLISIIQNGQLNSDRSSDRLIFSWRCKSSFSGSIPENICQPSSQALDASRVNNSADLTGLSANAHLSGSAFGISGLSPVASDSQSLYGTRLSSSSAASASESQSGVSCLLTPDITGASRSSKSADFGILSEGTHSSSEEVWRSLRRIRTVSFSQPEAEETRSGGEPPVAEGKKTVPGLTDMQTSAYTSAIKSSDLGLLSVPEILSISPPGACAVTVCQPSSKVLDPSRLNDSANLTGVSTKGHLSGSAFGFSSLLSVAPDSQSLDGTRLSLNSVGSPSGSQSGVSCLLTTDITCALSRSKSAGFVVVSEGTNTEEVWKSLSRIPTVSVSQAEADGTEADGPGWSGEPSLAEGNQAVPGLIDIQTPAYTSANKYSDLALPCVPETPSLPPQEAWTVNWRKRNSCTYNENTCSCAGCMPRTSSSEIVCGSKFTHSQCISSTAKRRRIFGLSMNSIKLLHTAVPGVGLLSSVYPLACQVEPSTRMSSQLLLSGQHDASGSEAPASSEQSSHNPDRWCSSPTTWSLKHDSFRFQSASYSRCRQMACRHTSGVVVASSQVSFPDQAGLRKLLKAVGRDVNRYPFRISEQAGGGLKLRKRGACGSHPASNTPDHGRCPRQAQPSGLQMSSQKLADIHRSQSAVLLGEPCSLLKVAHVDLLCKQGLLTLIREERCSPKGLSQDVRDSAILTRIRKSPPVCSFQLRLQGPLGANQARTFSELLPRTYTPDRVNRRAVFAIWKLPALPYTQTVPRFLVNLIPIVTRCVSTSPLSARRKNWSSSYRTEENTTKFSWDTRGSMEAIRPLRVKSLTFLAQNGVIVQERMGDAWEHVNLVSDIAAQPLSKRRRVTHSQTKLSVMSPSTRWRTTERRGDNTASAFAGNTYHGVLQLTVLRLPKELVTTCTDDLSSDDGKIFVVELEEPEDDLSGRLEHADNDYRCLGSNDAEYHATNLQSDRRCQTRGKGLVIDAAGQTGQNQQRRKEGTSRGDGRSVLSSGFSFQQLLSSVSHHDARTSFRMYSNGELLSIQSRFCTEEKCKFIPPEVQQFQSATGRETFGYSCAEEVRDASCKKLQNMSFSGKAVMIEAASESNYEDRYLSGDISRLTDVLVLRNSPKSSGMEDILPQHSSGSFREYRLTGQQCMTNTAVNLVKMEEIHLGDVLNLSIGMQEPDSQCETLVAESTIRRSSSNQAITSLSEIATPFLFPSLLPGEEHIAALDNGSTNTETVTTNSSVSVQKDFEEIEVLQANVLVEQQKSEFGQKLQTVLEKPFDKLELEELMKYVSVRKPQMRLRESRHETRHVPLSKEGFSYLEHYRDFGRKLESKKDPLDKLKLLRGFFFWIQHTCMSGAFIPWEGADEDDDSLQIIEEKCTAMKGSKAKTLNQKKRVQRRGLFTRESKPESSMHMSLRARKKAVYTDKLVRAKKTAKQPAAPKVKTEDDDRTFPSALKEMSASCLGAAKRRTSLRKKGSEQRGPVNTAAHRK